MQMHILLKIYKSYQFEISFLLLVILLFALLRPFLIREDIFQSMSNLTYCEVYYGKGLTMSDVDKLTDDEKDEFLSKLVSRDASLAKLYTKYIQSYSKQESLEKTLEDAIK